MQRCEQKDDGPPHCESYLLHLSHLREEEDASRTQTCHVLGVQRLLLAIELDWISNNDEHHH